MPAGRTRPAGIACAGTGSANVAAELLGPGLREIDTGHSPFWSVPEKLAGLLEEPI